MDKFKYDLKTLLILLIFIPVSPLVGVALVHNGKDFGDLGSFGDFFAGTTVPLLTFISFLALVITLKVQMEQLKIQSEELKNSVDEMKATRKEFEEQNKTLSFQRFENTFFQMVNLHNQIVENIEYNGGYGEAKGRNTFPKFYSIILHNYHPSPTNDPTDELRSIRIAYVEFLKDYEPLIGHYFRNLFRIVKFIDESIVLSDKDKKLYIGVIKAQLSSFELALLFYNSLNIIGTNFIPLIKNYNLLDNLNEDILIKETHLEIFHQETQ